MPSGKKARQQRREAANAPRTPPPVRSKGGPGGLRGPRQASPRVLAAAAVVVVVVIVGVVLGIVLSGRGSSGGTQPSNVPKIGSHTWTGALAGAADVYKLYKGIPQHGLVLGAPSAPATLTEFIDLQCPLCRDFEVTQMPTIVKKYVRTGKLKIEIEPWSILSPPDSPRGQAATLAASLQNLGFQFAELLYLNQGAENSGWLTTDMVRFAAASVDGLDVQQVVNDMGSSGVKSLVSEVDNVAATRNFNGTPTILLNHGKAKPQVVSVGVPNAATLLAQIQSAIKG